MDHGYDEKIPGQICLDVTSEVSTCMIQNHIILYITLLEIFLRI